jgi:Integrase core domain
MASYAAVALAERLPRTTETMIRVPLIAGLFSVADTWGPPECRQSKPTVRRAVIGSIRRECLDLVIVLNERHLRRVLRAYLAYYNVTRPHQSLDNDSPRRRAVQSVSSGHIVTVLEVGGFHHRYQRAA